ncbi:hypothetical protein FCM35_KLT19722 [Carex littledalei]|uniref:Uncharacterized protein n=1 Tax=Carex littledalei TaxID=544730 RepID=A0A833QY35_9POAL|nr:hypothetical protein FCM35_KLT19722 [Carex littledalei]
MYAVYGQAIAASVCVTFAEWNPSYFTVSSGGKRISRGAMSNEKHVYGQVTARHSLLTHPDATTTLFGKEIKELFHIKLGDLIPLLKTYVVIPCGSSLLLDIDLRHVLPNAPSELFVKTTLEITNQNRNNRFVVEDGGPAKLFVDVTLHHLIDEGMFY